ncbi:hypothetical protein GGP66_001324, partial [Salinibacter ruber]|nr:hypothetical protein [Salinibacter ruber]MCS3648683.1 hypothetical protein [Salinibacter ruber]MCS3673901.1 hypothetical protein [Salinibacter ruber]MCS3785215.1 hypothetical protein [Salinibacter ruber]MCS4038312.1 hypothetical protein [Salinibacter ruber]
REHRGEAFGAVGAVERSNVVQLNFKHLFVEEDQGAVLATGQFSEVG